MSEVRVHIKLSKAIIIVLVSVFSLSPCPVKRDILAIFDIHQVTNLNKVKAAGCNGITKFRHGKSIIAKADLKSENTSFFSNSGFTSFEFHEDQPFFSCFSGNTGNSPPKYILFKRLKINMISSIVNNHFY